MPRSATLPALFFDFDNTITVGDVLDEVIARYSATDEWRDWETEWQAGRMSTMECLRRQVDNVRVSRNDLLFFVSGALIDPEFTNIVRWAASNGIELAIVSDSFSMLIREILHRRGLPELPVYANELAFSNDRPEARFPFRDPDCARCAHCKAQHLRRSVGRTRIYVGDGLSDVCPALIADVVFAKDSLARELKQRGVPFRPFRALGDVLQFLHAQYGNVSGG